MPELVFGVVQESDAGYCAESLTENIFTDGDTWDELRKNVWKRPPRSFLTGLSEFASTLSATKSCGWREGSSRRFGCAPR
jgi:hypothetical protein